VPNSENRSQRKTEKYSPALEMQGSAHSKGKIGWAVPGVWISGGRRGNATPFVGGKKRLQTVGPLFKRERGILKDLAKSPREEFWSRLCDAKASVPDAVRMEKKLCPLSSKKNKQMMQLHRGDREGIPKMFIQG